MYSVYQNHLVEIINNNAPLKTLSVKEKIKIINNNAPLKTLSVKEKKRRLIPWITPCILASIKTL